MRIWPRHLYTVPFNGRVGYCAQGSRTWFAAQGLSWADFVAQGVEADVLLATGDPMALCLVEHATTMEEPHG